MVEYPLAARKRGLSGQVELEVEVEPSGRVRSLRVVSSSSHEVLDEAALDAVPSPTFGLIIYKGRGGSAGSATYPPKRPLAGAGAVALPVPEELLDDVVAELVGPRLLLT